MQSTQKCLEGVWVAVDTSVSCLCCYPCGEAARGALVRLIGNQRVRCQEHDIDRYGRVVAACWAGDVEINGEMVREGWAVAYEAFTHAYQADEREARRAR